MPTVEPTFQPSNIPSAAPSNAPTTAPTSQPVGILGDVTVTLIVDGEFVGGLIELAKLFLKLGLVSSKKK